MVDELVCSCGKEQHKCQELRERVMGELGADASDLVSLIVWSLWWDFSVTIEHIATDQWHGIVAQTFAVKHPHRNEPRIRMRMQCDRIEDGFAGIWEYFAKRLPSKGEVYQPEASA